MRLVPKQTPQHVQAVLERVRAQERDTFTPCATQAEFEALARAVRNERYADLVQPELPLAVAA